MLFESFPNNSQVWIYSSDRFFTEKENEFISSNLDAFIAEWATHGTDLFADSAILYNSFIVIVSDEEKVKSSGCSIDRSIRFIKDLGKELNIDFFNRLNVTLEKEEELKRIHFNDLSIYQDWNMFDPMVKTLDELRNNWLIPVKESRFVSI